MLRPLIDTELPAQTEIAATFESAGFTPIMHQVVNGAARRGSAQVSQA